MIGFFAQAAWLPDVFAGLMVLALFVYVVLDGYDMGVGVLMLGRPETERDAMLSSIAPFWDANETWLVLAVGLLLVAFPGAQGIVLTNLYFPVALMLLGLALRGVAFEFRAKGSKKAFWDSIFGLASVLMAFMQGFMMGALILGFSWGVPSFVFCALMGWSAVATCVLLGSGWLLARTEGDLRARFFFVASCGLRCMAMGIFLISIAMPMLMPRIYDRWFSWPEVVLLSPIPLLTIALGVWLYTRLSRKSLGAWHAFGVSAAILALAFLGIAYSFYPYIVPDTVEIRASAAAPESLALLLIGALVALPAILGYTFYVHKVFAGKTQETLY